MLNLAGNKDYDPKLPWAFRITENRVIVADLFTYVDNQRCTGDTKYICWMDLQRLARYMPYLGLKYVARNRREVGDKGEIGEIGEKGEVSEK